jgi:hypothetical protein
MMTTAPAAKARIVTLLQGWAGLAGIQVSYGGPVRDTEIPATREMIFLGPVTEAIGEWAALGRLRTRETYHIAITVMLEQAGDVEQAAEQRAADLFAEVQKALKTDPTLAALLEQGIYLSNGSIIATPMAEPVGGFAVTATGQLVCQAVVVSNP